jgi:hypothetical protein
MVRTNIRANNPPKIMATDTRYEVERGLKTMEGSIPAEERRGM